MCGAAGDAGHSRAEPLSAVQLSSTWDSFCMDVPHNPPPNGDLIHTWKCADITDQLWTYTGQIWPGGASLRGQLRAQGKCLDFPYGDYRNDIQLIVWDCHNGANQLWSRGWNSHGSWVFQAYGNQEFCIDIRYSPPGYDTPVTLGRCADITDQVWVELTRL